jgi:TolB protein
MMKKLAVLAALGAVAVALAQQAAATYPGAADGRIAFGATAPGEANPDIYSVLPNGEALRQLTDDAGFDGCPAYSADGRYIAYCHGESATAPQIDTWVMKQNGTKERQVTHLAGRATFPDFSADGTKIAFTATPAGSAAPDVSVVDLDSGDVTRLTTSPAFDGYPAWSPDGSKIVFLSGRSGRNQVWLMNADGSSQERLTFDALPKDQLPDWSSDGSQIAYVEKTAPTGGAIWVMNAGGSNQHPLTSGADYLGSAWSPDGTEIATVDWPSRTV